MFLNPAGSGISITLAFFVVITLLMTKWYDPDNEYILFAMAEFTPSLCCVPGTSCVLEFNSAPFCVG